MPTRRNITRRLLAFVTAQVLAWSGPVWAKSKELMAEFPRYKELEGQGKCTEAILEAKRLIEPAGQEFHEVSR